MHFSVTLDFTSVVSVTNCWFKDYFSFSAFQLFVFRTSSLSRFLQIFLWCSGLLLAGLAGAGNAAAAGLSLDSGHDAVSLASTLQAPVVAGWLQDGWVRLRGMVRLPDPIIGVSDDPYWQGLETLNQAGLKPVVYYSGAPGSGWTGGKRATGYPLDLREAFAYARAVARAQYPLVAAYEVENEPDLYGAITNPEDYAAYLKAVALGLRAGAAEAERGLKPPALHNPRIRPDRAMAPQPGPPLILPGGLGLAPGPFFTQLEANDAFSYLDGLNFHYYSYPEDFSDEYRLFADALSHPEGGAPAGGWRRRNLPVFLTEYGYSLMNGPASRTVAGRVRQWRFFSVMAPQLADLGIAGAMAFYMPPYLEGGTNEFGLGMAPATSAPSDSGAPAEPGSPPAAGDRFRAGGLSFQPADFGRDRAEPWMLGIGAAVDETEASPALAYLAAQPSPRPGGLTTLTAEPSPIVIDFVPGRGLAPLKSYNGWLLQNGVGGDRSGSAELRVYNFSSRTVPGRLRLHNPAGLSTGLMGSEDRKLVLAPGTMVRIPLRINLSTDRFRRADWRVEFDPDDAREPPSRFATLLFPNASGMTKETVERFDHPLAAAEAARRLLLSRPLAAEEPHLQPQGRWLVTDGVEVREADGIWTFTISRLPPQPLRPAMAELPLPAGFVFPADDMLLFDFRTPDPVRAGAELSFDCYIRTESGNLFEALPRLKVKANWLTYSQVPENFTTVAFGRMKPPWRFRDNQPAALVFFLRPDKLPAVLEIRNPELAAWRVAAENETLKH